MEAKRVRIWNKIVYGGFGGYMGQYLYLSKYRASLYTVHFPFPPRSTVNREVTVVGSYNFQLASYNFQLGSYNFQLGSCNFLL